MNRPVQPPATSDVLEALHDLVLAAESSGSSPARLDRAVRRWSRDVHSPSEAVALAGAARASLGGSARHVEVLDLVTQLAVTAVAERQVLEALVDPLTGLATRSRMQDEGAQLLALSRRTGTPLTAVVLDVDGLKRVNDVQGHAAGDAALAEVGRAVREHLRRADCAFRWGGDEFVLLLPGSSARDARLVVERIQRSCTTPTSVGIATHTDLPDGADLVALLSAADADLYATRGALRAVRGRRRNPLGRLRHGLLLSLLALSAGLLGWTGATLAGLSGPSAVPPVQALGQGHVRVPVVAAPQATTRTMTPAVAAHVPVRVTAPVHRVVPAAAPRTAPVAHVPVAVPDLLTDPPLPDAPPPAPGLGGLVGGVVDLVHRLLPVL
jgi:diguanylate cyclase (GGDEF)-like protein